MHPVNFVEGTFQAPFRKCPHGVLDFGGRPNCSVCQTTRGIQIAAGELSANEVKRLKSANRFKQLDESFVVESADQVTSRRIKRGSSVGSLKQFDDLFR
jgi:hypothetical protein